MAGEKPMVVVTGVAGNLGQRLLPQLADFEVIGIDLKPPAGSGVKRFVQMDLGQEESCRDLTLLLRETRAMALVHLAFVLDPVRTDVLDTDRMWHINVAGTARVMEAVTEANRDDSVVQKFIFPSSVAVYGPDLAKPATEDTPLNAQSLPYALHKMECDRVVQQRAPSLRGCSAYMLRPHLMAGATMDNYMVGAFRGTPNGRSKRAEQMRNEGKRLPCVLPYGQKYLGNKLQFVHVDDVARLIAFLVRKNEPESQRLTILNVAGRGEALTFEGCIGMAKSKLVRVPSKWVMEMLLRYYWKSGMSAVPPEALPYMTSEYTMNTDRLRKFLGSDYERVIQYSIVDAFADCFRHEAGMAAPLAAAHQG